MKYSEAKQGRTFVIRLEDGDIIHEQIEKFAENKGVTRGYLTVLGGVDKNSTIVCGPKDGRSEKIIPTLTEINNVHEVTGTGTIFPDKNGKPVLHMHIACGRNDSAKIGCIRTGVKVWHILEVILVELLDSTSQRKLDNTIGFELLEP